MKKNNSVGYLPWSVTWTWGKNKKGEDRFRTKTQAEKAVKEFKSRKDLKGRSVYLNVQKRKLK